jgi:hypothetical protein
MATFVGSEPALQVNAVTSSATQIFQTSGTLPDGTVIASSFAANAIGVTVTNTGTVTIYVGGSTVTTATGCPVPAGTSLTLSGKVTSLYAITASATVEVLAGLTTVASVI